MKTQVKIKKEKIEETSVVEIHHCDYSKLRVKSEKSVEFEIFLPTIDENKNKKDYSADKPLKDDKLPLSSVTSKRLKCKECPKSFTTKPSLQQHFNIFHLKMRDFECSICKKLFPSNNHLTKHQSKHIETKDFQCKFCEKKFASAFYVSLHEERIHGKFLKLNF